MPSKLAQSSDEGASAGAKRGGSSSSRGAGGARGAPAGSAGQKPQPWDTGGGGAARAEGVAGGRGSGAASASGAGRARDTLEDLEFLSHKVAADKTKKEHEPEKSAKKKGSWWDPGSWFGGEGASKGKGEDTNERKERRNESFLYIERRREASVALEFERRSTNF